MNYADEKAKLETTREQLIAQVNFVSGQIALLDRLMHEARPNGEDKHAPHLTP